MDESEFRAMLPKLYGMSYAATAPLLKRMTPAQQKRAVAAIARANANDGGSTTPAPKAEPRISDEKVAAIYAARQQATAPPPTDSRGAPAFGTDAYNNAIFAKRSQASGAEQIGTPD